MNITDAYIDSDQEKVMLRNSGHHLEPKVDAVMSVNGSQKKFFVPGSKIFY